ncbi:MAG: gluconolaconase [Sphingomonadales bacterium]|nr:gluconolaconase [Sphingomonadales bacterium]
MTATASRYTAGFPATAAEGWSVARATPPSRLAGANGIRTGRDGRIYVAQVAGSAVSAVDPDTGEVEVVSGMGQGIVGPDDLVFDEAGNLYCTEITQGRVVRRTPSGEVTVIHGEMPVANPITCYQDRVIAGELRMDGRIIELDRSGAGNHRVIYDKCPLVNAFEVGPDGKLYFPAQGANEIWRISLDGGEPEVVAKDLGVPDSVKFHPDGYIVSTQVYSGQVLKIDPRTGAKEVLADIGAGLDNVTFVGNRTFVSHITGSIHEITAPGQARPLIDRGFQWPNGISEDSEGTLLIADGGFSHLMPHGGQPEVIGNYFVPGYPGWVRDSASTAAGEWVVTTADGVVSRWRPREQASEVLASGYAVPTGIAAGPNGAIVFAENTTGEIVSISGGATSTLASGLDAPMGVAIADDGTVYVAEAGKDRVVKLAGGRTETVLDDLGDPQGLAIRGNRLYVVDVKARALIESDLSGGNRRAIATDLPVGSPTGMPVKLGGVPNFCGPMWTFTGVATGRDGTIYVSGDAEGSVIAVKPA